MHFIHLLTAVSAASASAATFQGFVDLECQTATEEYVRVSGKELEALTTKDFAGAQAWPEASRNIIGPDNSKICRSNSEDTYKWLNVPQWKGRPDGRGGGSIAVIYYKETDTYSLCRYHAAVQSHNYAGFCR